MGKQWQAETDQACEKGSQAAFLGFGVVDYTALDVKLALCGLSQMSLYCPRATHAF